MNTRYSRAFLGGLAIFAIGGTAIPVTAQSIDETRVRKLEAEVRALQRTVFSGGTGRFFQPEIAGSTNTGTTSSTPSTTAVTDILVRMDALEAQLQGLTAQTEENTNSLRLLTTRIDALDGNGGAGTPAPMFTQPTPTPTATTAQPVSRPVVATPAGPTAERLAAVSQIAKPQTNDAGDDEYSYGFRLWNAGFYPEAQQQLTMFVERYPRHSRITYGRNLLGRAYLDDGKAEQAAPWFLKNYQAGKQDARAPDSLLYLAESMIAVNDTGRACIALSEFGETYPALASGRLANQYQSNVRKVSCN